ncbi:MAG: PAQR family membrane homeostasis protein TrhA [Pontimonas sp.]
MGARDNHEHEESGALSLPLLEESIEYRQLDHKPSWRGWIHLGTFPFALAAGIVLVALANGMTATIGSAVFALNSLLLFGVSAVYHRFDWSPTTKAVLRRIDHANIFLLIAGTYTPIALLALPEEQGQLLLWLVWSATVIGIGMRVLWLNAPRWIYVPIYLGLGWAAMMYIGELFAANVAMMVLVLVGGGLYTLGAIVYGAKWPSPSAKNFGFHEIFHSFTVLAFFCHWAAVLLIAMNPLSP